MSDMNIAISLIWFFLLLYALAGSVDMGAGFWALIYGRQNDTRAGQIANRFLSPSWKVTNTFLVLLVVAVIGFFPRGAFVLGTALLVPVSLVLILLTLRSAFMVFAYTSQEYTIPLLWISGITGLLIPGLLMTVLPVTLGGFIIMEDGAPHLLLGKVFTSPTVYAYVGFGIASELYLSSLFLSDYAREAEDEQTYRKYREAAAALGPIALAMGVLATYAMLPEAEWIVLRMRDNLIWFILSFAAFVAAYLALWKRNSRGSRGLPRVAVLFTAAQYTLASIGYGSAHLPYLIYPYLTVEEGFTNPLMFRSLLIGYTVSTLVLLPVFVWFWRLFLTDKRYIKPD
ncbi:cytochrome d ubiquinol oxidase subunit II [Paenibacillus tarimensis]|uniref:cytochrome d ubiquinol oxidase subunit II n=1 Tax=Paenibacillus tarimensis TaxID=416012 RepID=UPI001F19BF16|nr:cytochrome d ubiquinol oxidase subunit II [Paenibacillus tarimensis]MCF2944559.1 cytochrome d ubiquinol oxidase subunit II [Paenibacillus tarimensis]